MLKATVLPSCKGVVHCEGFLRVVKARCNTTLMRKATIAAELKGRAQ
jgi:hypothetical protein